MMNTNTTYETTHKNDWLGALAELPPILGILALIAL